MMTIDKNNYEAFMLDYLEGTISPKDKTQLLLFLDQHPELKDELDTDISIELKPQNKEETFSCKAALLKHPADEYEMSVKDYLLIKQHEEGLNRDEEAELVLVEPNEQQRIVEQKAYAKTSLKAENVIYPNKSRHRRFILWPVIKQVMVNRSVAAVAILALIFSIWLLQDFTSIEPVVATIETSENESTTVHVASAKIVEKSLTSDIKPSKDSLMKLSKDPMELKANRKKKDTKLKKKQLEPTQYLASIAAIQPLKTKPLNAYEYGLNVMMPQYMSNNLLRKELAAIYRKIEDDQESPTLSLALVESGVKVMNFFSKESVQMQKYYNADGKVVAYKVKGENLEVKRRAK